MIGDGRVFVNGKERSMMENACDHAKNKNLSLTSLYTTLGTSCNLHIAKKRGKQKEGRYVTHYLHCIASTWIIKR